MKTLIPPNSDIKVGQKMEFINPNYQGFYGYTGFVTRIRSNHIVRLNDEYTFYIKDLRKIN